MFFLLDGAFWGVALFWGVARSTFFVDDRYERSGERLLLRKILF
jgi:hypothetical protein